jgi:hypothetical protein
VPSSQNTFQLLAIFQDIVYQLLFIDWLRFEFIGCHEIWANLGEEIVEEIVLFREYIFSGSHRALETTIDRARSNYKVGLLKQVEPSLD